MEISLASSDTIRIVSGSAETTLSRASFGIDGMMVDMPGEYEKSGILLTVGRFGESLFAHLVIEGRSIGYLDAPVVEADERLSEFLWEVDILFVPGVKDSAKTVEKIESRIVIPYGETRETLLHSLGQASEAIKKFKPKDADFEAADVKYVLLESGE